MIRPFIYGPTGATPPRFGLLDTTAGQPPKLPADFDEMLRAAPTLTGSADLNWLRHEARLNSTKGDGAEEDGAL